MVVTVKISPGKEPCTLPKPTRKPTSCTALVSAVGKTFRGQLNTPSMCHQQDFGIFSVIINFVVIVIAVEGSGLRTQFCWNKMSYSFKSSSLIEAQVEMQALTEVLIFAQKQDSKAISMKRLCMLMKEIVSNKVRWPVAHLKCQNLKIHHSLDWSCACAWHKAWQKIGAQGRFIK